MLVAEIHGKVVPEALNDEDFLTSAVFGHLRYLPPSVFWNDLFARSRDLPDRDGNERSLSETLVADGVDVAGQTNLSAYFWSRHPTLGEPDLLLVFHGAGVPLIILIEIKLWSLKSGKDDQLVRYLSVLKDLKALRPTLPFDVNNAQSYLIYLTPRESLAEVRKSIEGIHIEEKVEARKRIFRLQWQDVAEIAKACTLTSVPPSNMILEDVARFLISRGFECFKGFKTVESLESLDGECGRFYAPMSSSQPLNAFHGWTEIQGISSIVIRRGKWNL